MTSSGKKCANVQQGNVNLRCPIAGAGVLTV